MITLKQSQKLTEKSREASSKISKEERYVDKKIREAAVNGYGCVDIEFEYTNHIVIDKLNKLGYQLKPVYKTVNHGCGFRDTYQSGYKVSW